MSAPQYPPTFWALIEQRAATTPERVMFADDRDNTLTFASYRDIAERVAAALHRRGVRAGTKVAWQLPTTLDAAVLLAALARLGAVQVPIIPILRRQEVGFIAAQTGAELLIVPASWRGFDHASMAREVAADTGCDVLVVDLDRAVDGIALELGDPATVPPAPDAAAPEGSDPVVRWVFYTSGTTSDPKGARHTDRSVMSGASGILCNQGLSPDDCYPIAFPLTHIGGTVLITAQLVVGCRYVLLSSFDPTESPLLMARHQPTLLGSALPFLRAYMDAQRRHGDEPLFPNLQMCVSGGAPKPPDLHDEVRRTLGGRGVVSSYGLTEFPISAAAGPDDSDDALARTEGRLSPDVELRVIGADGAEVAAGIEGELRFRGPQMMQGYVDASLDSAAFDELGFFRTGDLGVIEPSGHVRITGRLKDIIIRNAENLSAQEIEDAVASHPDVADVAVIGVPDARTGERACAVVVPAPGSTGEELTLASIGAHCRGLGLATHKLPEQLVVVESLPRNTMGKVLKQELRRQVLAG